MAVVQRTGLAFDTEVADSNPDGDIFTLIFFAPFSFLKAQLKP